MKSIIYICLFLAPFIKSDDPLPPLPEDGSCVLGQSYQDGCNVCSCFAEKALLCKRKEDCLDKVVENISPAENEKEGGPIQKCQEGEMKKGPWGGCSFCACKKEKDGINEWHCSDKDCKLYRRKRGAGTILDLKNTPCAPNDSFRLDCNTCYCNSAKSGYRCTDKNCVPENATEIALAHNTTELVSLNISSILVEATNTSTNNNSSIANSEVESTNASSSTTVVESNSLSSEAISVTLPSIESTSAHIGATNSSISQTSVNNTITTNLSLR